MGVVAELGADMVGVGLAGAQPSWTLPMPRKAPAGTLLV